MASFCLKLEVVNTSATPMKTFSWNIIKPDITYYDHSGGSIGSDAERAKLVVEAKFDDLDDPLMTGPKVRTSYGTLIHPDKR